MDRVALPFDVLNLFYIFERVEEIKSIHKFIYSLEKSNLLAQTLE